MLPFLFRIIFCSIIPAGLLLVSLASCTKQHGDSIDTNLSIPQHNHIADDLLTNFENKRHIESIEKFIVIDGIGIYYMGKLNGGGAVLGRLTQPGQVEEFSDFALGRPIDFIPAYGFQNGNPIANFQLITVGKYDNIPVISRYRPDNAQLRMWKYMYALQSIDATWYDPISQKLFFAGKPHAGTPQLYLFDAKEIAPSISEKIDSIPLTSKENIRRVVNIQQGNSTETVVLICDSITENGNYSVMEEVNFITRTNHSISNSAIPLQEKVKVLTANQHNKMLVAYTRDTLSPSLYLPYRIYENDQFENHQPQLPALRNNHIIYDVKLHNNTVYACGIANCTDFRSGKSHSGNALLLKIEGGKATAFTFGNASYLSAFKHMEVIGQKVYLSGFTKQYTSPLDESQWHSAYSFSEPYFVSIDLEKLK